jgi:hypothetical protein
MMRAKLGLGPMSSEAIEAVFRYSQREMRELMFVTSRNQIDYSGGYVNNWRTSDYARFLRSMRHRYPGSRVTVCRDHCGPGFNGRSDLEDTYRTIESDIDAGFSLIHVDFCHHGRNRREQMAASKSAIEHCLRLDPSVLLEVGTDDTNISCRATDLRELRDEVAFFADFCRPEFYVVNTGALVKETRQTGTFNKPFAEEVAALLKVFGFRLKEHQCDYLSQQDLALRKGIVDAMNVAPQLGTVQTSIVLHECLRHGIETDELTTEVFKGGRWKKWMLDGTLAEPTYCTRIAAHYHFASDSYKRLIERLSTVTDIHTTILDALDGIIKRYDTSQNTD